MLTPADSPSSPSDYNAVVVSGFDIQAPQQDLAAPNAAAIGAAMDRQVAAHAELNTPAGSGEINIPDGVASTDWPTH